MSTMFPFPNTFVFHAAARVISAESCRAIGPHRGGHGPDQCGHARGREELEWHGEMLRTVCSTLQ